MKYKIKEEKGWVWIYHDDKCCGFLTENKNLTLFADEAEIKGVVIYSEKNTITWSKDPCIVAHRPDRLKNLGNLYKKGSENGL